MHRFPFAGYLANTDYDWFIALRNSGLSDEVNFWLPGATAPRATPGTPWLFKLKTPHNVVVGGGFYTYYTRMPASVAWDTFETRNGVASLSELVARLQRYRDNRVTDKTEIGCVVLAQPFFLREDEWIRMPSDWAKNIVSGKYYDLTAGEGGRIWSQITERANQAPYRVSLGEAIGAPRLIVPRLGQGAFRLMVTDAYARRCAVSGERTVPVLEAAHIKPFRVVKEHDIRNGLLLRSDIHRLFDAGYVTVGPDLRFRVSKALRDDYSNGRIYYELHGRSIALPANPGQHPAKDALEYHADVIFRDKSE